jgi:hypothetical protein
MKKVALIGAGISGLGMARALGERNNAYDHFEKMPELIHGIFPKEYKNIYILGMGQPRYGAGPLVSLASEMICDSISISDELEKPMGYTLSREEVVGNYPIRVAGMIYASILLGAYTMIGHAMFLGMDRSINWFDIKSQTERFGTRAKPLFEGIFNNLTKYF